ncbi:ATP-dependent helicase [Amycolatopsis acidicola]|uniref:ATP-dependent helicase n=1 Tax=Amycolatopsis acidicola TaxID=2596893 RepID=A0A5N0VED7_9PSEU|nr:UvrD-helicase domain-containing protein [Amycolatopsis acidicola]KAA9163211.1 ATP-dependent helicase [Amycolatopsis acidicola]
MSRPAGTDASVEGLTSEQRIAAASEVRNLFIEAGPGTGKTTVSAQRLGVQRFGSEFRQDNRAVIAVSFTRAATKTLAQRAVRVWGPTVAQWPHRVVTLDTIVADLVHDLLRSALLRWPNGHTELSVHDSWASFSGTTWNRTTYTITVQGDRIAIEPGWVATNRATVPATETLPLLRQGTCTHEDVRAVLEQALQEPRLRDFVRERLQATTRALIVDEVFDANDLDLDIIETAIQANVAVTLVGDPWQALYVFRGARPDRVPLLLQRTGVPTLPLTQSFRWLEPAQRTLAENLRSGASVTLDTQILAHGFDRVDVALALTWKSLWELKGGVLPLAFKAFGGSAEEAAATLLLNHVTRNVFNLDATYLNDALTALAITDHDVPRQLEPKLQTVTEILRQAGPKVSTTAYDALKNVIGEVSPRALRPAHYRYTGRLDLIRTRLLHPGRPAPGLTTHQAKGGEWDVVAVRLTESERQALESGLLMTEDTHRKLYVACTRARRQTVELI